MDPIEGQGSAPQGNDQGFQNDSGNTVNVNPAWNEVLSVVPQQLHSQITPHFQKWDQNFQNKVNEVHSQYADWKPFIEGGVSPEDVQYGLGLVNAISNNPQEVLQALQEWMNAENGNQQNQQPEQQGQNNQQASQEGFDLSQHPQFQQMDQLVQNMAQIFLQQQEAEQQSQADQELESDLNSLKEKYGEFDVNYVCGVAIANEKFDAQGLEEAVQQYKQLEQGILSGKRQPGPPVLGGGGANPVQPTPQSQLNSGDRKSLVAQMLSNALNNS